MRFLKITVLFVLLTVLTQIGGVIYLIARLFRWPLLTFVALYTAATLATVQIAPHFGRVALPCFGQQAALMHNPLYCALNRNYVTPDLAQVLRALGDDIAAKHSGSRTRILDANFPFPGMPLLPHLSHNDGRKADIALFYKDTNATRSPIGYFAFEQGHTHCPQNKVTLRWDLDWLQPVFATYPLDPARTKSAIEALTQMSKVEKIFLEPHLQEYLRVSHPKIRFQGCRAARHDDHIHFQIK